MATTMTRREMIAERRAQEAARNNIRLGTITREERDPTPEEEAAIAKSFTAQDAFTAQLEKAEADDSMLARIGDLETGGDAAPAPRRSRSSTGSLLAVGHQLVKTPLYEELRKTPTRGQGWRSQSFGEIHLYAATLTEDPASGGSLVVPTYRPGIVPLPMPPLNIADLFAVGVTNSNAVMVMVEKVVSNAAAGVPEGGVKPESGITFEQRSEPVRKIATVLPCSDEIIEDVAGLTSYLNARLTIFVREEEEDQLINGDGLGGNLLGILARPGLAASVVRTDPETNADAIARQIFAIQAATNLPVSGLVIHPGNWAKILLTKDTAGNYLGDGPFREPSQLSLWGIPVALSQRLAVGTALVGAFATGAQIFRRGPVRVDASSSHADFWVKNLIMLRAELRESLAVYRAASFGLVTGLQ